MRYIRIVHYYYYYYYYSYYIVGWGRRGAVAGRGVPLGAGGALLPLTLYSNGALLVLVVVFWGCGSALLALSWRYRSFMNYYTGKNYYKENKGEISNERMKKLMIGALSVPFNMVIAFLWHVYTFFISEQFYWTFFHLLFVYLPIICSWFCLNFLYSNTVILDKNPRYIL